MRILITGGGGQLATELGSVLREDEVTALTHAHLDIADPRQVARAVADLQPDAVVNTAAYHRVDVCEEEPEQSFLVNAAAPQRLAAACRRHGSLLVQLSSDYVFDGLKGEAYREEDPVNPVSVYGASRAAGEMAVRCTMDRHIIVRTTGLYGVAGRTTGRGNFVEMMLRLAREGKPISVVNDQVLTPSSARDVAETIARLIHLDARGTFHVTNSGECSWYEFAAKIFRLARLQVDLTPTTQAERPSPARRPTYSVLAHDALRRLGIPDLRPWQEALASYLRERGDP